MRKTIAAIFLFIASNAAGQNIIKVRIISAPLSITSTFQITCKQFGVSFKYVKKDTTFTDPVCIKLIIEKQKMATRLKRKEGIDVRGKILIYKDDNSNEELCFDEFGYFYDGKNYYKNKSLLSFLLSKRIVTY